MRIIVFCCCLLVLAGCEKEIDLNPEAAEPKLVVDATLESGQAPFIILSTSINYFTIVNPSIISASAVQNATVTLSDGIKTSTLKKYNTPIGLGYNLTYYSNDTSNSSSAIIGEFGKTYTLKINHNSKDYTSVTTIPFAAKRIDSLWYKQVYANKDSQQVYLMGKLVDPSGFGNYIRYFTKVNRSTFLPGLASVFDDQIVDGQTYDIQVDQGIDRNNPPENNDYGFFKKGDTITVKLANIDKATYDFWRTTEFNYSSIGNPFSTPTKVASNVSNGALGAFCGYAVQFRSLIIPR